MATIKTELEAKLYGALKRIASYQPVERLQRKSWDDWGLADGDEAVAMAYENVLQEAKSAIKGVRQARKEQER